LFCCWCCGNKNPLSSYPKPTDKVRNSTKGAISSHVAGFINCGTATLQSLAQLHGKYQFINVPYIKFVKRYSSKNNCAAGMCSAQSIKTPSRAPPLGEILIISMLIVAPCENGVSSSSSSRFNICQNYFIPQME